MGSVHEGWEKIWMFKPFQADREILLAVLEGTRGGMLSRDEALRASRCTAEALDRVLSHLSIMGLISDEGGILRASHRQRVGIAVEAVKAGAGVERVSRGLGWREFEDISAHILEENGFTVHRGFRFTAQGRRREVDIIASRRPLLICAECKRWSRGMQGTAVRRISEAHLERVKALGENLARYARRLGLMAWSQAIIIPIAISLTSPTSKMYEGLPIIPILELPSFLSEFEAHMDSLLHFRVHLPTVRRPIQTTLRPRG